MKNLFLCISLFSFQGDGNIRYYEVSESEPYFTFLNEYRSSSPQRGFGVMPKRGVDVTACEIYRFYKLHNNNFVEPIAMTVPRRVRMIRFSVLTYVVIYFLHQAFLFMLFWFLLIDCRMLLFENLRYLS